MAAETKKEWTLEDLDLSEVVPALGIEQLATDLRALHQSVVDLASHVEQGDISGEEYTNQLNAIAATGKRILGDVNNRYRDYCKHLEDTYVTLLNPQMPDDS